VPILKVADKTSFSLNSDSTATPMKTASGNRNKILRAIKRSNQKLWPFWADTQCWRPDILITQRFHSLPNKNSLWKPYKNLSAIPRSDKKLWHFSADTLVWSTRHPRHRVGIPYIPHGNQPLETPVKILAWSNGRIKCYGPFESILMVGDQTSSSLSDSIAHPTKTASGSPYKNLRAIQRSDQKLWPLWADTQGWRPNILVPEQRFNNLPKENSLWKPL